MSLNYNFEHFSDIFLTPQRLYTSNRAAKSKPFKLGVLQFSCTVFLRRNYLAIKEYQLCRNKNNNNSALN